MVQFFEKSLELVQFIHRVSGYLLAGLRDSGLVAGPHIGHANRPPHRPSLGFAALLAQIGAGNRDRDDRSTMGNRESSINFLAVILLGPDPCARALSVGLSGFTTSIRGARA